MENADTERLTEWINPNPSTLDGVSFQTNAIYCGDCADVMNRFPEDAVDLELIRKWGNLVRFSLNCV
jgi:hypothetical protein